MQSHCFHDFEEFAASVRGVDCNMLLRNAKSRVWSINQVELGSIQVQLGRLGSGNIVEGQAAVNGFMLYLPLSDDCEYAANGTVLKRNAFAILEPGCEFCVSTKFDHDWCTVVIPREMLTAEGRSENASTESQEFACRTTTADRRLASRFRKSVQRVMRAAARCQEFESELAAHFAAKELLTVSSLILGRRQLTEPENNGRPRLPRRDIIDRSLSLLKSGDSEPVDVGAMANAAGVSERTLRTAFKEYFGTGPVRYLQLRRLHLIRRALRAADPETTTVTDVLVQHGEWEFSRFASRYGRLFGERPSETLRSRKTVIAVHPSISAR